LKKYLNLRFVTRVDLRLLAEHSDKIAANFDDGAS
jgi:hypothetical protein